MGTEVISVIAALFLFTLYFLMYKFAWRDCKPFEEVDNKEEKVSIFNTMETFKGKVEKEIKAKYEPPVQAIIDIVKSEQYSVQDFLDYAEGDIEWLESMLQARRGTFVVGREDWDDHCIATYDVADNIGNSFMLTRFSDEMQDGFCYSYLSDVFSPEEAEALWSVLIEDSRNYNNLKTAINTLETKYRREKMVKDYEQYQNS